MLNLTKENFASTVQDNATVFVDVWAPWCGPCRQFGPIFEKVAEGHEDVVFGKLNMDDEQEIAGALGIMAVPTIMAFRDGVLVYNQSGAMNQTQFSGLVEQVKAMDVEAVKAEAAQKA